MIEALYEASSAGVEIDCIVRGACCLVPGVEGVSEHIRVRSIVGEFLEHSRIWMFANGGRAEWYIGSADLMERNLDRRVEVVTPVEDHEAQARLARIVEVLLADDRRSWQLGPDGRWRRTEVIESVRRARSTPSPILKDDAARRASAHPSRPSTRGRRRTRWIRAHDRRAGGAPVGGRAQVPDDRRRQRASACSRPTTSPGFAATGPAETVRHEDRYLDTADGALAGRGVRRPAAVDRPTARSSRSRASQRQDNGGATHRREELEGPADPSTPPARWPPSGARDAVVEIVGDRRCASSSRSARSVGSGNYARNGTVVEVSVDDVEVLVGAQVAERFAELELELRDGDEAVDLEPLADLLGEIEELVAAESSKFERRPRGRAARSPRRTAEATSTTTTVGRRLRV